MPPRQSRGADLSARDSGRRMAPITLGGLMPQAIQPRRSALYVPGINTRAIEKARTLDADVLIFDLEDAVADAQKDAARENVCAALKAGGFKSETVVRVNDPSTKLGAADLKAVARCGCDAVLLPKIEKPQQVRDAHLRLTAGGAPAGHGLWAMVETALAGLRGQGDPVFSSPLQGLLMGPGDLAEDLRARQKG